MGGLFSSTDPNDRYKNTVGNPTDGMGLGQSIAGAQQGFGVNQQGQQAYINNLRQQAAGGGGPSVAEQMLRSQTDQNQRQAAGQIASQRGLNPALAARMVSDQSAQMSQQAAGQGAQLRAGEQLNAQGLLGQALGQQGAQNIGMLGQAGGLHNQGALGAAGINAGMANQAAGNSGLGKILGGALGGLGGAATMLGSGGGEHYAGGEIPGYASGGMMLEGGSVPGHALTPGDSPRNDTVDAKLSPGEIVLPRSVTKSDDPAEAARKFVQAILRRKGRTASKTSATLTHVKKAKAALDALSSHLGGDE
jgi:hypothetical protein